MEEKIVSMLRNLDFESELCSRKYLLKEYHLIGIPPEGWCSASLIKEPSTFGCLSNHTDVLYFQQCYCSDCIEAFPETKTPLDLP